jgi:superfamily II DNA or RNA helicase
MLTETASTAGQIDQRTYARGLSIDTRGAWDSNAEAMQAAQTEHSAIALAVSPSGVPYVRTPLDGDEALDGPRAIPIAAAFERGTGAGVLYLGAVEVGTSLPTPFAFFRDLGHELLAVVCGRADLESVRGRVDVAPPIERLQAMASALPPLAGAEYVTSDTLGALWTSALSELRRELAAWRGPIADYLRSKHAAWSVVGRVHFHLAENRRDPDAPFAFLATYTTRLSSSGTPQHRPLGHALEEYGAARDRERLLALLVPVQRAAEKSALVRSMVESGDLYHPLAWTPREARAFLEELPALEASGIVVRVPDGWSAKRPPRPQVHVTVGGRAPSLLGTEAVLDFAVTLALDSEPLSPEEQRAILSATSGLVLIKGRWVEADGAQLREVLDHWKRAERIAKQRGISFQEAMRLVSGARIGDGAAAPSDDVAAWSRVEPGPWMARVLDGLRAPDSLAAIDAGSELRATLRPYQRAGVQWLWSLHELGLGACLADDMGLGKTLQVLGLLLLRKRSSAKGPALLVVPASLVANWGAEAERFTPTLRLVVAHAATTGASQLAAIDAATIDAADAIVTTYGSLSRIPWLRERDWGVVILDEAQAIKNPGAKQTRAVKSLRSRARFALTGTPVENRLSDLWSLFDFLSPGLLGTAKQFTVTAKRMSSQAHDGYAPLRALMRPYVLRRLKTDKSVIADLPDKTEVTAFCSLTKTQATLYGQAVADLARALDGGREEGEKGIARRGAILASLMRMKQICNHPSQWLGDGVYGPGDSGKLARLRELCEPIASRQEKVLVFTQFREMTAPLARFLRDVFGREGLVLDGSTAVKARKERVDAFQDEKGPPFFVLSIKAGGTGLNLTAASHVIHFDRWWNPAVENQATDRAFRIGQKKNVLVHKFVCRGTVEERIDALIASKKTLAESVVSEGGAEGALTEMSNEDLVRLVTLDLASALGDEA